MNWYYAREGQHDGPHSDEALQGLIAAGQVDATTLIWREGMQNWQSISQAAPHLLAQGSVPPAPPLAAGVRCHECGGLFSASEMISIGGSSVCARCKPIRLQKLQEGVVSGGAREDLQRLLKIAKGQRGVNLAILLTFAGYALVMLGGFSATAPRSGTPNSFALLPLAGGVIILAALVLQIIYVYRLAAALGHTAIVWVLGVVFLSCIGLILLLVLSSKATKELREAGFKVGLLGGNPKDVQRRMGAI